jgi:hypothetical protein
MQSPSYLDTQLCFSYIQLTRKRVLVINTCRSHLEVSMKASSFLIVCAVFLTLCGILHTEGLTASPKSGGPPAVGGQSRFAGWNVEYTLPQGWTVSQRVGRLQTLASNTEAGAIFLAPGMYRNANEAIADLSQFYQLLNLQGYPVDSPQSTSIAGLQAIVATYVSTDQAGRSVQGRFISLLTPHGTGLNALAASRLGRRQSTSRPLPPWREPGCYMRGRTAEDPPSPAVPLTATRRRWSSTAEEVTGGNLPPLFR